MIELQGIYKNTFDGRPRAPNRTKTVFYLTVNLPVPAGDRQTCSATLTIHSHYEYILRVRVKS